MYAGTDMQTALGLGIDLHVVKCRTSAQRTVASLSSQSAESKNIWCQQGGGGGRWRRCWSPAKCEEALWSQSRSEGTVGGGGAGIKPVKKLDQLIRHSLLVHPGHRHVVHAELTSLVVFRASLR